MNFPAAVIAAMALCNQHMVATRGNGNGLMIYGGVGSIGYSYCTSISGCSESKPPTKEELKKREDDQTEYTFSTGYAWEPEFQGKCLKIHDYTLKLEAQVSREADDARAVEKRAEKDAEQPTLDKGIAALPAIRK